MASLIGGGGDKGPAAPPPPTVMPTPDDASVKLAKKRKLADLTNRSGRLSTVLTDQGTSDTLG